MLVVMRFFIFFNLHFLQNFTENLEKNKYFEQINRILISVL